MSFLTEIESPSERSPQATFEFARKHLPSAWIDEALTATGTMSRRRRKLPAQSVIWLVIAMSIFRDRSIHAAVTQLALVEDSEALVGRATVAPGAVSKARTRLGEEPVRLLFRRTALEWAVSAAESDRWRELSVFAIDGTGFNVADTPANDAEFGRLESARARSAYPKVRVVALNAPRSHLLLDMQIRPYTVSEQAAAESLWDVIPDQSVTLIDRGFLAYTKLYNFHHSGTSRHWLSRAKSTTVVRNLRRLPDNTCIGELTLSRKDRKANPHLPEVMEVRVVEYQMPGFTKQRLLTSLLDFTLYPAKELIALYHERWEIELGFREKKVSMLERREALRSKTVAGTKQEIWGLGIAYNLVRLLMAEVAKTKGVSPVRISFRNALILIKDFAVVARYASPQMLPQLLTFLRTDIRGFVLPTRKRRFNPREVKIKMSNYPRKATPRCASG